MSAELLVVLSAFTVIMLIFYFLYIGRAEQLAQLQQSLDSSRNAYSFGSAMNFIYLGGNGAQINYNLFKGQNESIRATAIELTSSQNYISQSAPLIDGNTNISGNLSSGPLIIKNNNGLIQVG